MASKSDLDPWRVICAKLFELSSHDIPVIVEKTGLTVDWTLTDQQNYSHQTRKTIYRPRINASYEKLKEQDRLRVANITTSELVNRGKGDELNLDLKNIGWHIDADELKPASADVSELFFPVGTQHDAYVAIRDILQAASVSLRIVDPYIDGSLLKMLQTVSRTSIDVGILTYKTPPDFELEGKKFLSQHQNMKLSVRKSSEFHDRFIVVDERKCWHIGASIKDAGIRVFMLHEIEDNSNKVALIDQINQAWSSAAVVNI